MKTHFSSDRLSQWAANLLVGFLILFAMGLVVAALYCINERRDRDEHDALSLMHQRYIVYRKLSKRTDLSYDEFVVAYQANLLPNTQHK